MNDIYSFAFLVETPLITPDIYLDIPWQKHTSRFYLLLKMPTDMPGAAGGGEEQNKIIYSLPLQSGCFANIITLIISPVLDSPHC